MTDLPSIDTIIEDIEFELLMGITPSGEVGQALEAIRREQNRLRREYAATRRRLDGRDVASALLRLNDLILDVLHEVSSRLASVESVTDRSAGCVPAPTREDGEPASRAVAAAIEPTGSPAAPELCLDVDLDVEPIHLPVVGKYVDRFRLALHRVALYYVRRLAEQQGRVNVYQAGEVERLAQLVDEQQRRLEALQAEVTRRRAQALAGEIEPGAGSEHD